MTSKNSAAIDPKGINYTQPVKTNPFNVKIYLGTDSLAGVSVMFSKDDVGVTRKISPMLTNLLQLNEGKMLSYVTMGNQDYEEGATKLKGDYVTLVIADRTMTPPKIRALIDPILTRYKDIHQRLGGNYIIHEAAAKFAAEKEALQAQILKGNTTTEKGLIKIAEVMNRKINDHGGSITFHKIDDENIAHFTAVGGCTGCTSIDTTMHGLKNLIQNVDATKDTIKGISQIGGITLRF